MNEFIIYDEENYFGEDNQFYSFEEMYERAFNISMDEKGKVLFSDLVESSYGGDELELIKTKEFLRIDIPTINDRKIYADLSIIEFCGSGSTKDYKAVGIFYWNKESQSYELKFNFIKNKKLHLEKWRTDIDWRCSTVYKKTFKVIDNVQENKLGLIKDGK